MSKTTKGQLIQENLALVEENKKLREALLEANMVEKRSYKLMFARGTSKQSKNTLCNIGLVLSKDGQANITGVIATCVLNKGKPEIQPIGRGGYNFFGFKDQGSVEKLAKHILYLADHDQIPENYPVKFHGKVQTKPVNQLGSGVMVNGVELPGGPLKKAQSKVQLALC